MFDTDNGKLTLELLVFSPAPLLALFCPWSPVLLSKKDLANPKTRMDIMTEVGPVMLIGTNRYESIKYTDRAESIDPGSNKKVLYVKVDGRLKMEYPYLSN